VQNSPKDLYKKLFGKNGEDLALKTLKKRGYKLLERNYRTKFAEADLILEKDQIIVFAEVKSRSDDKFGTPAEAVTSVKQNRYRKLAEFYLSENGIFGAPISFLVAEVYKDGRVNIIENAF